MHHAGLSRRQVFLAFLAAPFSWLWPAKPGAATPPRQSLPARCPLGGSYVSTTTFEYDAAAAAQKTRWLNDHGPQATTYVYDANRQK